MDLTIWVQHLTNEYKIRQQHCNVLICYQAYRGHLNYLRTIDSGIKIRLPNFPEQISQSVVYWISKIQGLKISRKVSSGDLTQYLNGEWSPVEVKCSSSSGPTSFGPSEKWKILYYVKVEDENFVVYRINISSDDKKLLDYPVSKKETYQHQCLQKRRPRFDMDKFIRFHADSCLKIYDGHLISFLKELK